MQTEYHGACHCGAIAYTYRSAMPTASWSVRACQCSFCRAHGALTAGDPDSSIVFVAADAGMLRRYRFGLGTADFLLCRNCGVYLGAVIASAGTHRGIVNLRALTELPRDLPAQAPASYDGEDIRARVSRRQQRWAPVHGVPD